MAQKALAGAAGFFGGFGNRMLQIRQQDHDEGTETFRRMEGFHLQNLQSQTLTPEGQRVSLDALKELYQGHGAKDMDPGGMFDAIQGLYGGDSRQEVAQNPPNIEQQIGGGVDPTIQTPASGQAGQQQQGPGMFVDPLQQKRQVMQMRAEVEGGAEQASQQQRMDQIDAMGLSPEQAQILKAQMIARTNLPATRPEKMVETAESGFQPESQIGGLSSPKKESSFVTDFAKRQQQYTEMGLNETEAAQRAQQDVQEDQASAKRMDKARLQSVRALTKQRQAAAERGEDFKLKPQFALSLYNSARNAAQKQAELIAGGDVTEFKSREEIQEIADRLTYEELVKRGVRPEEVMDVISAGLNQDEPGKPLPRPHNPNWRPAQ